MAEMPSCKKCGHPHWRFVACGDRPQSLKRAYPITSVPEGFRPWKSADTTPSFPLTSVPEGFRVSTRPLPRRTDG